jgi:hypothetical protein
MIISLFMRVTPAGHAGGEGRRRCPVAARARTSRCTHEDAEQHERPDRQDVGDDTHRIEPQNTTPAYGLRLPAEASDAD